MGGFFQVLLHTCTGTHNIIKGITTLISYTLWNICRYFSWVAKIHGVLKHWHGKIWDQDVTFDEIKSYSHYNVQLRLLKDKFCASSLDMIEDVSPCKTKFTNFLAELDALLLHQIQGQPNAKWCSIPALIEEYGVSFPQKTLALIVSKVSFPGQTQKTQICNFLAPSAIEFEPSRDIHLMPHRSMTLNELSTLVEKVQSFLEPINDYLDMMVYFKLNKCTLFDDYRQLYLKKFRVSQEHADMSTHSDSMSSRKSKQFAHSYQRAPRQAKPKSKSQEQNPSMRSLVNSLKSMQDLINKIIVGTATYMEIFVENEDLLDQSNINEEFTVIFNYALIVKKLSSSSCKGLHGVQSMLEIFQCTTFVKNISLVCEKYDMKACEKDPLLTEVMKLTQIYADKDERLKITSLEAIRKMNRVKEILCKSEKANLKCLEIFEAVRKSAEFHAFVRGNGFYGQQGQDIFYQQHGLITAQLQHEVYDEQVLNHLLAAFKVISPFMDTGKSFEQLMSEVTELNAVHGLMELKTVNANITLIKYWFSKAEVRHLFSYMFYIIIWLSFSCIQTPTPGRYCRRCS